MFKSFFMLLARSSKPFRADRFISIGSHVMLNNSAWPFPGRVVDMYHDEHGVLVFEVWIDPSGPDQPGGPQVPADITQLESIK